MFVAGILSTVQCALEGVASDESVGVALLAGPAGIEC